MADVELARWLGNGADPLDPAAVQYRAKPARGARSCAGCLFKGQKAAICKAAGAAARLAGMPDCEDSDAVTGRTFVYYEIELDPRQQRIATEELK